MFVKSIKAMFAKSESYYPDLNLANQWVDFTETGHFIVFQDFWLLSLNHTEISTKTD